MPDVSSPDRHTVTIDRRFRGPVASGNGGVSAGLAAAALSGSVAVRLHIPPPVDVPLTIHEDEDVVTVLRGETIVMDCRAAEVPIGLPVTGRDLEEVLAATFDRGPGEVPQDHAAPECFVCGPRDDGLRVFVRNLPGTEAWSTTWSPDESVAPDGQHAARHVLWGVLDCPAGMAVLRGPVDGDLPFFPALARLTARIDHDIPVGERVAVLAWPTSEDERRANAGTAIVGGDGTVLAMAYAEHARLPVDFAL